jgi:hypothetical protein
MPRGYVERIREIERDQTGVRSACRRHRSVVWSTFDGGLANQSLRSRDRQASVNFAAPPVRQD